MAFKLIILVTFVIFAAISSIIPLVSKIDATNECSQIFYIFTVSVLNKVSLKGFVQRLNFKTKQNKNFAGMFSRKMNPYFSRFLSGNSLVLMESASGETFKVISNNFYFHATLFSSAALIGPNLRPNYVHK